MSKVTFIKKGEFKKRFNVENVDLIGPGLFTEEDFIELQKLGSNSNLFRKVSTFFSYLPFVLKNPRFFRSFITPQLFASVAKFLGIAESLSREQEGIDLRQKYLISNCVLRVGIAASFKPRHLLEIGTYLGWGAASFKMVIPECVVYTMNTREIAGSNNPIDQELIGCFYRKKNLDVKQIWADSTKFDYSKLPLMDVVYIDGNHKYEYVYSDLENTSKITKKCIILDDYIPPEKSNKKGVVFGPWSEGVVKATNDFLKQNPHRFKEAYWIENTQLCVLIKQ